MEDKMQKQAAALLTAAMVGKTREIESLKTIVDLWREYDRLLEIRSDIDYLAAILTTARVLDIKPELINVPEVIKIHNMVREELKHHISTAVADDQRETCCHLAAAYIAITPEIETVGEIMGALNRFMEHVKIRDDYDKLAAVLVMGRMHDSKNKIEPEEVPPLMERLKELIRESRPGPPDEGSSGA
jgi:hypothetical protein